MLEKDRPAPLRRIVGELIPAADGYARRKVELECGHHTWCSGAAIYRARCWRCRKSVSAPESIIV